MKRRSLVALTLSIVLILGLWLALTPERSEAGPRLLPPRPGESEEGGGEGEEESDEPPPPPSFSAVYGTVTNWGYRGEPKVPIDLSGAGWRTEVTSDDNGFYGRGGLGIGIGLVNLKAPPWCRSMTQDMAIRFDGYKALEVNLVCYGGETPPVLPVTPLMKVDRLRASPGEQVTYTVTVMNSLNSPMAGVTLTALLPSEMKDIEASSSQGNTEVWDNLVTAELGWLELGEMAQVTIVATVKEGTPAGTVLTNHASLLYTAGLAAQSPPVAVEVK